MTDNDDGPRLERIERQIRELKAVPEFFHRDHVERWAGGAVEHGVVEENLGGWAQLSETEKLVRLDGLDWQGVSPLERLVVTEGEVDLNRVSPAVQRIYLGQLRDEVIHSLAGRRLPPPSAVIDNPRAWLPEAGKGNEHGHGRESGPGRGR